MVERSGYNEHGYNTSSVEKYDLRTKQWTEVEIMRQSKSQVAALVRGDYIQAMVPSLLNGKIFMLLVGMPTRKD